MTIKHIQWGTVLKIQEYLSLNSILEYLQNGDQQQCLKMPYYMNKVILETKLKIKSLVLKLETTLTLILSLKIIKEKLSVASQTTIIYLSNTIVNRTLSSSHLRA